VFCDLRLFQISSLYPKHRVSSSEANILFCPRSLKMFSEVDYLMADFDFEV
ncbi:hypothetical protein LEMLEM_LOCUS24023, partial [Lemmus lemmus]